MSPCAEVRTIGDVVALLAEALQGGLRSGDVEARWPAAPRADALRELREDLLDALEHIPVDKSGRMIESAWRGSPAFDDLQFYVRQLEALEPRTPLT